MTKFKLHKLTSPYHRAFVADLIQRWPDLESRWRLDRDQPVLEEDRGMDYVGARLDMSHPTFGERGFFIHVRPCDVMYGIGEMHEHEWIDEDDLVEDVPLSRSRELLRAHQQNPSPDSEHYTLIRKQVVDKIAALWEERSVYFTQFFVNSGGVSGIWPLDEIDEEIERYRIRSHAGDKSLYAQITSARGTHDRKIPWRTV